VTVWMLTTQTGTSRNRCKQRLVVLHADILMNPDRTPKTRSVWPILRVKIVRRKTWSWIGTLQSVTVHGLN